MYGGLLLLIIVLFTVSHVFFSFCSCYSFFSFTNSFIPLVLLFLLLLFCLLLLLWSTSLLLAIIYCWIYFHLAFLTLSKFNGESLDKLSLLDCKLTNLTDIFRIASMPYLSINNWFSSAISSPRLWLLLSSGSSLPIGDSLLLSFQDLRQLFTGTTNALDVLFCFASTTTTDRLTPLTSLLIETHTTLHLIA